MPKRRKAHRNRFRTYLRELPVRFEKIYNNIKWKEGDYEQGERPYYYSNVRLRSESEDRMFGRFLADKGYSFDNGDYNFSTYYNKKDKTITTHYPGSGE